MTCRIRLYNSRNILAPIFLWRDQSKNSSVKTRHFHDKQDYKNTQIGVGPDLLAFFQGQSHH